MQNEETTSEKTRDELRERIEKLENTVKRLFQIMDAQVYPDERPEDVS
jgi:hypothetical protein